MVVLNIDENFEVKLTCAFKNDLRNLANFHQGTTSKVSKLGLWWDPFIQSRKYTSLKFTGDLRVITMKNDAKTELELLVSSKSTWGIWRMLTRALENLKLFHFNGMLLTKVCNVQAKKSTEELCLIALKIDVKF